MSGERPPIGEDDLVAAVDGRLTPERAAAVDAFVAGSPDVGARIAAERRDREALREALAPIAAEPIPSRLRIAALQAERRRRGRGLGRIAAAGLIFAIGMGAGAAVTHRYDGPGTVRVPAYATVAEEASAAHRTFVVEVAHPVEVDAGREAHLVGWLSKRLGRRIVAPDLAGLGWKLIGGRLLPAGTTAAAQLMYEDAGGKRMTLWVQAIDGETTAFRFRKDATSSTFAWVDRGWGFAVTAPLDRDGLLPIAEAVYERLDAGGDAGAAGRS
jgi:anti-sigma factor RsiW